MLIRKAGEADLRGVAQVHVDTWKATYRGIVPDEFLDSLSYADSEARLRRYLKQIAAGSGDRIYVAESDDGQVAGIATGGKSRADHAPLSAEVKSVYVLPSHQRQGVGKRLIDALVTDLASDGFSSVIICVLKENKNARRFYEGIGGQLAGKGLINIGGKDLEEVMYLWPDISCLVARTAHPGITCDKDAAEFQGAGLLAQGVGSR
ncbi:MAG: GNAT family N-acetyltransferase [Bacillota bacterium]|nr:GNAT family N-acetyltransferase [Bacillota bacterium]